MTREELDSYLSEQRTARVATTSAGGEPHVVPLWFVWVDGAMFLNSTLGNVTVENMVRSGRATVTVDDGDTYDDLRGVTLHGDVSRADGDPRLPDVEVAWSQKYLGGNPTPYSRWRNRAWFRLEPDRVASWDFRKIPEARARQKGR